MNKVALKKTLYSVIVAVLMIASNAYAGNSDFAGLSLSIGDTINTDISNNHVGYFYQNKFGGSLAAPGYQYSSGYGLDNNESVKLLSPRISAEYTLFPTDMFSLGIALTLNPFDQDRRYASGTFNFNNVTGQADNINKFSMTTTFLQKHEESLALRPGMLVTDKLLGYLSLSLHHMTADIHSSTKSLSGLDGNQKYLNSRNRDEDFFGIGLGAGAKYKLDEHWFLDSNIEWVCYESKSIGAAGLVSTGDEVTLLQSQKFRPEFVATSIMLGYKF